MVEIFVYFMKNWEWADIRQVFLLPQVWIVNHYVKSYSNNISYENINTGISVIFKTKRELKCQNELFLKYHLSGNTSFYVSITENMWRTFGVINDDP